MLRLCVLLLLPAAALLAQEGPLRVIAFGAHPDDCDIRAAGTAAKFRALGAPVKFVSVTNGDNRNLMAAQIAQRFFKVPRVITRLYDPIRQSVYREMGLETFCPTSLGADLVRDYFLTGVNRGHETADDPSTVGAS